MTKLTSLFAVAVVLAAPAVAQAAPARTTSLAPGGAFTWDGPVGYGFDYLGNGTDNALPCGSTHQCDDTLIKTTAVGDLTVHIKGDTAEPEDMDLYVYASDESGTQGKLLKEGVTAAPDETVVIGEADPGYYLVRADWALGAGWNYKGEATLATVEGAAPVQEVAPTTASNAAPTGKASAPKAKKTFSGTAADDGSVKKVAVGILKKQGSSCQQLKSKSAQFAKSGCGAPTKFFTAKGTSKWSFKLSKALKKGKYVLFARITDDKGATTVVQRAFTVR